MGRHDAGHRTLNRLQRRQRMVDAVYNEGDGAFSLVRSRFRAACYNIEAAEIRGATLRRLTVIGRGGFFLANLKAA
ncbi:MAG: hypothetical protein WA384_16230 [Rhodomicrobium sp.]